MRHVFGLCAGRHNCPVDEYIYPEVIDGLDVTRLIEQADKAIPMDAKTITVYVTGFTPAMLAVAHVCFRRRITLVTMNFDRDKGDYCRLPVMFWEDHSERVPGW